VAPVCLPATPGFGRRGGTSRSSSGRKNTKEGFAVEVKRIQISDGKLDFADLSLKPQFAAKIHQLNACHLKP